MFRPTSTLRPLIQIVINFLSKFQWLKTKTTKLSFSSTPWYQQPEFVTLITTVLTDILQSVNNQETAEWMKSEVSDQFLKKLTDMLPIKYFTAADRTLLPEKLPDNAKLYLSTHWNQYYIQNVVIQEEPQLRSLWFSEDLLREAAKGADRTEYFSNQIKEKNSEQIVNLLNLSLPYVVFVITLTNGGFNSIHAYYSLTGLKHPNDQILVCNLPNCDAGSGGVCLGDFKGFSETQETPISLDEKVKKAVDFFWQSKFTSLWDGYSRTVKRDNQLNLWNWSELSRTNPDFIFQAQWLTNPETFIGLVESHLMTKIKNTLFYQLMEKTLKNTLSQTDFSVRMSLLKRVECVSLLLFSAIEKECQNALQKE